MLKGSEPPRQLGMARWPSMWQGWPFLPFQNQPTTKVRHGFYKIKSRCKMNRTHNILSLLLKAIGSVELWNSRLSEIVLFAMSWFSFVKEILLSLTNNLGVIALKWQIGLWHWILPKCFWELSSICHAQFFWIKWIETLYWMIVRAFGVITSIECWLPLDGGALLIVKMRWSLWVFLF